MTHGELELPSWLNNVKDDLYSIIAALQTKEEVEAFLQLALTEKECFTISCRIRAGILLCEGFNTREVRDLCNHSVDNAPNISRAVISRANIEIAQSAQFRTFYERIKSESDDQENR